MFNGQGGVAANKNGGFQKFSNNNATPRSGNGNVPQGSGKPNSTNSFANKAGPNGGSNSSPSRMNHGNNLATRPGKTYQTEARVRENNASANNGHDHGQTGGQHGHGNEPRLNKR